MHMPTEFYRFLFWIVKFLIIIANEFNTGDTCSDILTTTQYISTQSTTSISMECEQANELGVGCQNGKRINELII